MSLTTIIIAIIARDSTIEEVTPSPSFWYTAPAVCTWPRIQVTLSKSVTRTKATDFDVELVVANEATETQRNCLKGIQIYLLIGIKL